MGIRLGLGQRVGVVRQELLEGHAADTDERPVGPGIGLLERRRASEPSDETTHRAELFYSNR